MKKWITGKNILSLCVSGILALEVLMLMDTVTVFRGGETALAVAAGIGVLLTVAFLLLSRRFLRQLTVIMVALPVAVAVLTAGSVMCWRQFSAKAGYEAADAGKNQIYGDRKVMLIVPHQDDDLNILGGVLEEYVRYGSELYPVFVTNGDFFGKAEERYQEAIRVFETIGVPEENLVFLGYGDSWNPEGPHIYNAEPGVVMESYFGRTETYGTAVHPAYREGREYTIDNLMEDMGAVILEYRPDVIFCSDYDHHEDHKALTMLFEKVMGTLLKENPEYKPVVYKAYAYGTAWEAEPDFYADNILSTQNVFGQDYNQQPAVYRWEDRTRFPVKGEGLSRSLISAEGYKLLDMYTSQDADLQATRVVNGDKVAWRRYTDSLCLDAQIEVTSGNGRLLNDFMLIENHDLMDKDRMPYDGVWIPEAQDSEKTAVAVLSEEGSVHSVVLYDHPSEEHNVLNALLCFDDGTQMETGPLDPGGAATVIVVDKENVSSFSIVLKDVQGENAGLSEVEAFAHKPGRNGRFIKLMDQHENFLYDYLMPRNGQAELSVYVHGDLPEVTAADYLVEISGEQGTAVLENGKISVTCPDGEDFVLTVTCLETDVSDSIYIRNPGRLERRWETFWQKAEAAVFIRYSMAEQKRLLVCSIPEKIAYVIKHL